MSLTGLMNVCELPFYINLTSWKILQTPNINEKRTFGTASLVDGSDTKYTGIIWQHFTSFPDPRKVKAFDKTVVSALESCQRKSWCFVSIKRISIINGEINGELASISTVAIQDSVEACGSVDDVELLPQESEIANAVPLSIFSWNGWIHTAPENRDTCHVFQVPCGDEIANSQ